MDSRKPCGGPGLTITGSDTKWIYTVFLAAILATAGATIHPSFGEGILLHTQQPYSFSNNRTLIAEDVDPSSGVVWLKLYSRNETLKSALLGVGDRFVYDRMNLTVNKIYAGGERDLVELGLNNSSAVNSSDHPISTNISKNFSSSVTLNISAQPNTPEKSPGFGFLAILTIILANWLINAIRPRSQTKDS